MKNTIKSNTLTSVAVVAGTVLTAKNVLGFASGRLIQDRDYTVLETRIMASGVMEVLIAYRADKKAWFETNRFEKVVVAEFTVGQKVRLLSDTGIETKAEYGDVFVVEGVRNNEIKIINNDGRGHWLRVERFEAAGTTLADFIRDLARAAAEEENEVKDNDNDCDCDDCDDYSCPCNENEETQARVQMIGMAPKASSGLTQEEKDTLIKLLIEKLMK